MSIPSPVQTDNRKIEAIVGTQDLTIALCRRSDRQPRCTHGKGVEKFTSCRHHSSNCSLSAANRIVCERRRVHSPFAYFNACLKCRSWPQPCHMNSRGSYSPPDQVTHSRLRQRHSQRGD